MQPREYRFDDRLSMSCGYSAATDVKSVLLQAIPGAVNVIQAAKENDKQGVDWWVEMATAKFLAVDAKVREEDWRAKYPDQDDIALETWSVVEKNVVGWTRDEGKKCDYVLWLWKDTGRFCLIPFPMLCKVFRLNWQEWSSQYKTRKQFTPRSTGGYHSECVFVPRRQIWAAIYGQFGGDSILAKGGA